MDVGVDHRHDRIPPRDGAPRVSASLAVGAVTYVAAALVAGLATARAADHLRGDGHPYGLFQDPLYALASVLGPATILAGYALVLAGLLEVRACLAGRRRVGAAVMVGGVAILLGVFAVSVVHRLWWAPGDETSFRTAERFSLWTGRLGLIGGLHVAAGLTLIAWGSPRLIAAAVLAIAAAPFASSSRGIDDWVNRTFGDGYTGWHTAIATIVGVVVLVAAAVWIVRRALRDATAVPVPREARGIALRRTAVALGVAAASAVVSGIVLSFIFDDPKHGLLEAGSRVLPLVWLTAIGFLVAGLAGVARRPDTGTPHLRLVLAAVLVAIAFGVEVTRTGSFDGYVMTVMLLSRGFEEHPLDLLAVVAEAVLLAGLLLAISAIARLADDTGAPARPHAGLPVVAVVVVVVATIALGAALHEVAFAAMKSEDPGLGARAALVASGLSRALAVAAVAWLAVRGGAVVRAGVPALPIAALRR
jgi:hypothetical protein